MATYYDALNDFFKSLGSERLASSAQLVYLHLLQLNNRSGNGGHVQISDRELNELTQLSRPTVTKAKRILKNCGLIDFKTDAKNPHAGTRYTLQKFSQSVSQSISQSVSQSVSQSAGESIIHARDKTEDVKTKDLSAPATARARAPVNYDIDRLVERWESSEAFGKIDMLIVAKLTALLKTYSVDEILSAMDKAILSNDNRRGINYNYFEAILKGGEKNARVGGQSRVNRPNVLNFAAQRTAINSGVLQAGKGRFDDDPEYN